MILQAEVAFVGARAAVGLPLFFFRRHGLALRIVGDEDTVQGDDSPRPFNRDVHGVPLARTPLRPRCGFGEGVKDARAVVIVVVVVNLDLIAAIDGHPGFGRLFRDANIHPRV